MGSYEYLLSLYPFESHIHTLENKEQGALRVCRVTGSGSVREGSRLVADESFRVVFVCLRRVPGLTDDKAVVVADQSWRQKLYPSPPLQSPKSTHDDASDLSLSPGDQGARQ